MMFNVMAFLGVTQQSAAKTGIIVCVMGLIWFAMSFITGKRRKSVSAVIYLAVGILFLFYGAACLALSFLGSSPLEKLKTAGIFVLLAAGAALILIIGTAIKNRRMIPEGSKDLADKRDPDNKEEV